MKQHTTEKNTLDILNQQVSSLHRLLRQLEPQSRFDFIKEMLPTLLSYSHPNPTTAPQKIRARTQSPIQALTQQELDLIDDLAKKTEILYNTMDNGSFF